MSSQVNTKLILMVGIILGALITAGAYRLLGFHGGAAMNNSEAVDEPIYWVAPMDVNYRRDKPGKSPMGMDLVPVYEDESNGLEAGPGTVRISPDVVNNLGVRTSQAEYRTLYSEIKTVGYVKYDEGQLIHIHPRVEGWIDKLYITAAGDPVTKGQPLYEIYSPALVNAQEELVLALGRNNKRLIRASVDRLTALQLPDRVINEIKKTRTVKQNVTFYSPQTGVLNTLNIRQGFYVKPGTTLMSIGALDQVWVEAEVFESQAASVTKGLLVTMTLDFLPGRVWQGRVDYVYPSLDVKTRTVKVRLRFDNDGRELKPNMFTQVTIHTQGDKALLVPKAAVVRTGSMDRVVMALGEGRYKSVEIGLGRTSGDFAEILFGLEKGDLVVTSAQFLLDSESNKTSDFKRLNHDADAAVNTEKLVWVEAEINSVTPQHRMVNVRHNAIPLWDWPPMTMDFVVAPEVDINSLKVGARLRIEVNKTTGGNYEITAIDDGGHAVPDSATVEGVINSLMVAQRMVNISRDAIEKWGSPAATVNFVVDPSVEMSELSKGMRVQFTFSLKNGEFLISAIQGIAQKEPNP